MAKKGLPLDGILLLNKPLAISANSALQRAKRLFNAQKAGHTGSLDPYASGMLPICFGEATKFSQYFLEADKAYSVVMRLGTTTTTGDIEGSIITQKPIPDLNEKDIRCVFEEFIGEQQQIPSMYSAIKHEGRPLYRLARQGKVIERKSRTIQIYAIEFQGITHGTQRVQTRQEIEAIQANAINRETSISHANLLSEENQISHENPLSEENPLSSEISCLDVTFEVRCSKGTYIRSLVEDIGARLGCGAYVIGLHRLYVAPFITYPMISLDVLEALAPEERHLHLMAIPAVLSLFFPLLPVSASIAAELRRGLEVTLKSEDDPPTAAGMVALLTEQGDFLGLGERFSSGLIKPKRLIHQSTAFSNESLTVI